MLDDVLKQWDAVEVSAMDVYRDIFRLGEGFLQLSGKDKASRDHRGNPIGYWKNNGDEHGHFRVMFEDTFEETLAELQEGDFAILNGITYFGRKNVQDMADKMYALVFDLDYLEDKNLNNFLSGAYAAKVYPIPNYIVLSGHGCHLYYVLEDPVILRPYMKVFMKELKYKLLYRMWNPYTSTDDHIQYQGINQGFRVIGGKSKIEGVRTRAFRLPRNRVSLEELCSFDDLTIPEKAKSEQGLTLEEAKRKYPEWYQRRVIEKQEPGIGHWECKRDLYDWWKRQIQIGATHHHRYFAIMCLAIYGIKSGISEEEVEADAYSLIPFMNSLAPDDPFRKSDVKSALECYDHKYARFPRNDIAKISGIAIPVNKRNFQKQSDHLEEARAIRDIRSRRRGERWDAHNGRHTKQQEVLQWIQTHDGGSKSDCIKDTGLSKPTVYKWWPK